MSALGYIPFGELVNDRAESAMELETCERLYKLIDKTDVDGPELIRKLEERINGNIAIIAAIDRELAIRKAVAA